jgi:protein required for attachment to host cells
MNRTCIIVADGGLARFLGVEAVESPRARLALVERTVLRNNADLKVLGASVTGRVRTETNTNRGSGPVHPMEARRERHRGELDRRFGMEITRQAANLTKGWEKGVVVLVAEPQLLGLMRESMRKVLHPGIELKELAKDYTHLAPTELHEHLELNRLVPAPRRAREI